MTVGDLFLGFYNQSEFNLGGRFLAGMCVGIIDRDAEHSGWLCQRSALASGGINTFGIAMTLEIDREQGCLCTHLIDPRSRRTPAFSAGGKH